MDVYLLGRRATIRALVVAAGGPLRMYHSWPHDVVPTGAHSTGRTHWPGLSSVFRGGIGAGSTRRWSWSL
jgi:hypothetical protein